MSEAHFPGIDFHLGPEQFVSVVGFTFLAQSKEKLQESNMEQILHRNKIKILEPDCL